MKIGLLGKMLASILLPAIIGLLLVSGFSYRQSEQTLRQQSRNDILTMLDMQAVGLQALFGGLEDALGMLSTYQRVNGLLRAYSQHADEAQLEKASSIADSAFKDFTNHNSNVAFAGVIGADGKVLAIMLREAPNPANLLAKTIAPEDISSVACRDKTPLKASQAPPPEKLPPFLPCP